ncbi:MAG: hypothetical protein WC483_00570 [Candidatus Paceibacterota bacterium]
MRQSSSLPSALSPSRTERLVDSARRASEEGAAASTAATLFFSTPSSRRWGLTKREDDWPSPLPLAVVPLAVVPLAVVPLAVVPLAVVPLAVVPLAGSERITRVERPWTNSTIPAPSIRGGTKTA